MRAVVAGPPYDGRGGSDAAATQEQGAWNMRSSCTSAAAGSHEIWFHPALNRTTAIANHPGDMPEGTPRAILKQAGIGPEAFLHKK